MQINIVGTEDILRTLKELAGGRTNQEVRRALVSASRPMVDQARKNTALFNRGYSTGQLKRAIGYKDKVYGGNKAGKVIVVIGARSGYAADISIAKRHRTVFREPTRYIHLIEKGHRIYHGHGITKVRSKRVTAVDMAKAAKAARTAKLAKATGESRSNGSFVQGTHFLQRAFDATRSQCLALFQTELNSKLFKWGR